MRVLITIWMFIMPTTAFLKQEDWETFNSSLLIEVSRPKGVFTCTGVALSPTLIVTAAHCLEGEITKVRVFTQNYYDAKNPSLKVAKYKLHPEYKPGQSRFSSDLAKIYLKQPLPTTINILPIYKEQMVYGEIFRFGFGERNKKNIRTVITPTLKFVNVRDRVVELNDKFSYSGDSGGPVFVRRGNDSFVLAVHSTLSFGPEGKYSYNPLLSSYQDWIFEN